jgi:hypothetical protein
LNTPIALIIIGLIVGIYSGFLGLGGGTIMIPVMIFALKFDPKVAVGTSLAIMVPALIPTVIGHYLHGTVKIGPALWIAAGMLVGGPLGAWIVQYLPSNTVRLLFGFVVVFVATYTIFGMQTLPRALVMSALVTLLAGALYLGARWHDQRYPAPPATSAISPRNIPINPA